MRARPPATLGQNQSTFTALQINNEATLNAVIANPIKLYVCCEYTTVYKETMLFEDTVVIILKEPMPYKPRRFELTIDATEGWHGITSLGKST